MANIKNDLILRALKKEETERTPVWMMRQAGRYLPEYREVRKKYDFLTMCKTPELAAEVTIQPISRLDVDAAILFSDILVVPEAMGLPFLIEEKKGPVFEKVLTDRQSIEQLKEFDPEESLRYVMDAITVTLQGLNGSVPLLGFAGSPFTLLTYMVEGEGTKSFTKIKKFIYSQPELAHLALGKIANAVGLYLSAKIARGVSAVQIFDTWGGILPPGDYQEFSLRYIEQVVQQIKRKDESVILFAKDISIPYSEFHHLPIEALSIDSGHHLSEVRTQTNGKFALQGNFEPGKLYGNVDSIDIEVKRILEDYGNRPGHVFNLGHGIFPDVSPDNALAMINAVKKFSKREK
mgnify:CR=1 FL=1